MDNRKYFLEFNKATVRVEIGVRLYNILYDTLPIKEVGTVAVDTEDSVSLGLVIRIQEDAQYVKEKIEQALTIVDIVQDELDSMLDKIMHLKEVCTDDTWVAKYHADNILHELTERIKEEGKQNDNT